MLNYTFNEIESITDKIHEAMESRESTVINVIELAQQLGFSVYETEFDNSQIDGMVINSKEERSIYVNQHNLPVRNRFTIAHELGHIILHHDDNQAEEYKIIDYRGNNTSYDPKEHEANMFAASLLMPKYKAIEVWEDVQNIDDFANIFKVSKAAASVRLQNLGLI